MGSEEQALVPVQMGRVEIAASINAARADQLVALDARGNVTSMRRLMIRSLPFAVIAGGLIGGTLALSTALAGVLALPLVGGVFAGWILYVRGAQGIRRSAELIAQDRLDVAAAQVGSLQRKWMPFGSLRGYVAGHAAAIAWRRGNLRAALEHTERALGELQATSLRRAGPVYWMQLLNRVQLLAALDRVDEAERAMAQAREAPDGDWVSLEREFTELFLAFCHDDPRRLPEDLHEWVRSSLQTNVFGGNVVLLSWVYDRRREPDMAVHLLAESESRLERWHLDRTFPKLWRWVQAAQRRLRPDAASLL